MNFNCLYCYRTCELINKTGLIYSYYLIFQCEYDKSNYQVYSDSEILKIYWEPILIKDQRYAVNIYPGPKPEFYVYHWRAPSFRCRIPLGVHYFLELYP